MNAKDFLVLYVDDEWANRVVFEQSFGPRFRIRTVDSGAAALEIFKSETVAVLVTDQRMPGMSGAELLAHVKALHPDTLRVVVTAYSDLDPILQAVNEGLVARYIIKPWDRAELEQILLWAIEAYALGRENSMLQMRLMRTERLVTLGSIGAAVLHDLHQPLSHLLINVERLNHFVAATPRLGELLQRHGGELPQADRDALTYLSEELGDIVRDLSSGCGMMRELTSSLRHFLQPERPVETTATDPLPVIRYALSACREPAVRAQARLIYDGSQSLPRVRMGSTELTQVLINLLGNATQALLEPAKPGGHVVISAFEQAGSLRFIVNDNGPGIARDVLKMIGTPFFSTRPDGTGLGLAQCRRLIERSGGTMRIDSVEGQGTTVTFHVPLAT